MNITRIKESDFDEIIKIHQKYYADEFTVADFFNRTLDMYVIRDAITNDIVTAGGIRPIVEAVAVTNKEHSIRKRKCALSMLLEMCEKMTIAHNYDQLHVFIQDQKWKSHLEKFGFTPTVGQPLVKILG